ncbi:hypothetical protein [Mucilaginibacter sp.]
MYAEAKKLHLIEELLKVDSDAILAELETILSKSKSRSHNFKNFVGILSIEEVDELERNIEEGCEQIH